MDEPRITPVLCRLLCALALCFPAVVDVGAEEPSGRSMGGLPITRPVVPLTEPRPAESDAHPWRVGRKETDAEPTASFIDSLKGTDAAFQVVLGQGRLFTSKEPIASESGVAAIAVGDPTVVDFEVLPNPRMIRILGRRAGITDLTISTAQGKTYSFEVHVTYDLDLLRAQLRQVFPDAHLRLAQIREHLIIEGQARTTDQVARIVQMIQAYLASVQVAVQEQSQTSAEEAPRFPTQEPPASEPETGPSNEQPGAAGREPGEGTARPGTGRQSTQVTFPQAQIINLIRVPGVQQVLLQVRIAELNRTALREIGVDWLLNSDNATLGTQIAGNSPQLRSPVQLSSLLLGQSTTAFGIFPSGELFVFMRALRRNSVLHILAEPNLVAMHGQEANFLAGGEFPVPVPQAATGGGLSTITIQFKQFGVQLNFVPYILDDETIRLRVAPESSTIDQAIGTEIAGTVVPGVNTRRVNTTVELKQGQTLALAGLLSVEMDGQTSRIPLVGDLPYIGTLFSNTSHRRQEKELIVLVTPHLISPMNHGQVPGVPGEEVLAPNDLELYLLGRIEGRTGRPFRPTASWDNPLHLVEFMKLERRHVCGPVGFADE